MLRIRKQKNSFEMYDEFESYLPSNKYLVRRFSSIWTMDAKYDNRYLDYS